MTVLAWDGKTLAADKQITFGGTPVPCTKIFRVEDALIGCTGEAQEGLSFVAWWKAGCPDPKPEFKEGFCALVVRNNKLWKYENMLVSILIDMPCWGAGSGADYAIGAMAAGKNAAEAVEIACRFDVSCGLGIDTLTLEG